MTIRNSLTALLLWFFSVAAHGVAPCGARGAQPLPALFGDGNVYLRVRLGDAAAMWMALDTGTNPSAIDRGIANNLGMTLAPAVNGTGFGSTPVPSRKGVVKQLGVGPLTQTDVVFEAVDLGGRKAPDGSPLAGLLGYSFLRNRVVQIDYPAKLVRIFECPVARRAGDLPMRLDHGAPTVRARIGTAFIDTLIDSGGSYNVLITPETARAAGLSASYRRAQPITGSGYAGEQVARLGRASDVRVGTIDRRNPDTVYATFGTAPLHAGAALGIYFLQGLRITLDYRAMRVRLEQRPHAQ